MDLELQAVRDTGLIAAEIRSIKEQTQRMILDGAIEIGRRLTEAKSQVPHGEWGAWLRDEVEFSQSTAGNLMRIFQEYGDAQGSLFGAVAKSQTFGNLTYSKALALLAVPSEEREAFMSENNVEDMSTRELDRVIRERDEAMESQAAAMRLAAEKEHATREAERRAIEAKRCFSEAKAEIDRIQAEKTVLEAQLAELEVREPPESPGGEPRPAGMQMTFPRSHPTAEPDQQALDAARSEAAAIARKEAEDALKKRIAKVDEARAKAEAAREAAEQELERLRQEREREQSEASDKIERLEKQLAASGSEMVTVFRTHFETAQETLNKMVGCILDLDEDEGDRAKLVNALSAMCSLYDKALQSVGAAG